PPSCRGASAYHPSTRMAALSMSAAIRATWFPFTSVLPTTANYWAATTRRFAAASTVGCPAPVVAHEGVVVFTVQLNHVVPPSSVIFSVPPVGTAVFSVKDTAAILL